MLFAVLASGPASAAPATVGAAVEEAGAADAEPSAGADAPSDPADSNDTGKSADSEPTAATTSTATPVKTPVESAVEDPRIQPDVFGLPPSDRLDPYGPRPPGVPQLSRAQVLAFSLENPLIASASDEIEAMDATLQQARFAWVPTIRTRTLVAPGVSTSCEDLQIQVTNPTTNTNRMEDFQYCRPRNGVDVDTIRGYFNQISAAGVTVRLSAEAVVPIYTFGKLKSAKAIATAGKALAVLNRERMRQETTLRVYQAYATLLLARESITILEEAWKVIQEARIGVEKDLGMGEDPDEEENLDRDPADLMRIELGELEIEERLLEARKIEALSLAALWALGGEAAPPGFDIKERELLPDQVAGGMRTGEYYRDLAVRERPEAKMAGGAVEIRKAVERLQRANFLPDIGLLVSAGYAFSSSADASMSALYYNDRYNYSRILVALGVTWNLDFHNSVFRLRKARAERRSAEHKREAALLLLGLEVDKAHRGLVQAQRAIDLTAQASKKARQLVVDLQVKETVGGGDLRELQRALTTWAEWRFKHFQAIMQHNVALADLSRAVGTPLVAD